MAARKKRKSKSKGSGKAKGRRTKKKRGKAKRRKGGKLPDKVIRQFAKALKKPKNKHALKIYREVLAA